MPLSTGKGMTRTEVSFSPVVENGSLCEESKTLAILNEIRDLYEDRLKRIDEAGEGCTEVKVKVLQAWVRDLGEQNTMLIQAVEQLEREASERVTLLQEGLQRSSQAALSYMEKLDKQDNKEKDILIADLKEKNEELEETEKALSKLKKENKLLRDDNNMKDDQLQEMKKKLEKLNNNLCDLKNQSGSLEVNYKPTSDKFISQSLEELDIHLHKTMQEKTVLVEEVDHLKIQLKINVSEIEQLTKTVADMGKSARDMREALTAEVADKHDRILSLRREVQLLEERCRQADMQTHFKDDIIKEMRKDIKIARLKLASLDPDHQHNVGSNDHQYWTSLFTNLPHLQSSQFPFPQCNTHEEQHTQYVCNNSTEDQQLLSNAKSPQLVRVNISPGSAHHPLNSNQQLHIPEKTVNSGNERVLSNFLNTENSKASPPKSIYQYSNMFLEGDSGQFMPDVAEQLGAEETYYEVRRRNSPPSRDVQMSKNGKDISNSDHEKPLTNCATQVGNIEKKDIAHDDSNCSKHKHKHAHNQPQHNSVFNYPPRKL